VWVDEDEGDTFSASTVEEIPFPRSSDGRRTRGASLSLVPSDDVISVSAVCPLL